MSDDRDLQFHVDRAQAWLVELWSAKSIDLHLCDPQRQHEGRDQHGLLANIREDTRVLLSALARNQRISAPKPVGVWGAPGSYQRGYEEGWNAALLASRNHANLGAKCDVLVPAEPTVDMLAAGGDALAQMTGTNPCSAAHYMWVRMVEAARNREISM